MANLNIAVEILGKDNASPAVRAFSGSLDTLQRVGHGITGTFGGIVGGLGDIAKSAAGVALGVGFTKLPGMLLDFAKGAGEDAAASGRLATSLHNLGGNFTAQLDNVNKAIVAGQKLAFTDDEVRDSFQFLAQATNSSDEALKRQQIAMNLARGANIPFTQATKLLGRVSEENVDVFKRLGIEFGKNATEADVMRVVSEKYAGQAERFASSVPGMFAQSQIAISEIQEGIGNAVLPLLFKFTEFLSSNLPLIQDFFGSTADFIAEQMAPAIDDLFSALTPAISMIPSMLTAAQQAISFFTTGSGDIETFRGVLNTLIGPSGAQGVINVFTNLTGFFQTVVLPLFQGIGQVAQKVFAGDFKGAFDTAFNTLMTFGQSIATSVVGWGKQLIGWIGPMVPGVVAELGNYASRLLQTLSDQLPKIKEQALKWGNELWQFVVTATPIVISKLTDLWNGIVGWFSTNTPLFIERLTRWKDETVAWLAAAIPLAQAKLGEYWDQITGWFGTNTPLLIEKLQTWTDQFSAWIVPSIVPTQQKLTEYAQNVWTWLTTNAETFGQRMVNEWIPSVVNWIDNAIPQLGDKLIGISDAVIAWIDGLGKDSGEEIDLTWIPAFTGWLFNLGIKLNVAFVGIVAKFAQWLIDIGLEISKWVETSGPKFQAAMNGLGQRMVQGIWEGIKSLTGWLTQQITDFIGGMIQAGIDRLRAHSPSMEAYEKLGIPFVIGIGNAIQDKGPWLRETVTKALEDYLVIPSQIKAYEAYSTMGKVTIPQAIDDITPDLYDRFSTMAKVPVQAIDDSMPALYEIYASKGKDTIVSALDTIEPTILEKALDLGWKTIQSFATGVGNGSQSVIDEWLNLLPHLPGGGGTGGGGTPGGGTGGGGTGPPDTSPGTGGSYSGPFRQDPLYKLLEENLGWHAQVPGKKMLDLIGVDYDPATDTSRGHGTEGTNRFKSGFYRVWYRIQSLLNSGAVKSVQEALTTAVGWVMDNTTPAYRNQLGWIVESRQFGGPVQAGRSYLVHQDEVITMGGNGHVTPAPQAASGVTINQLHIHLPRWIRDVDEAAEEIHQALLRLKRRYGDLELA